MTSKRDILAYQISTLPLSYVPRIDEFYVTQQKIKEPSYKVTAFNEPDFTVKEPTLSQWHYLDPAKTDELLKLKNDRETRNFLATTLSNIYPKGRPKDIFVHLLFDVVKFCRSRDFDTEKSAATMSQFYQTHIYFTSGLEVSAEKLYIYFKELVMCHSLPFPPSKKKIFTLKEAKEVLDFFCKIYLRNLPLIQYLCQPNYALYLNYEIPPAPPGLSAKEGKQKGKGKAGKKPKEGKKKKK